MKNYWRCHYGDGGFDQKPQWHRASGVTGGGIRTGLFLWQVKVHRNNYITFFISIMVCNDMYH